MGVEPKIGGFSAKMDGENKGKPYEQTDDLGGPPLFLDFFGNTQIFVAFCCVKHKHVGFLISLIRIHLLFAVPLKTTRLEPEKADGNSKINYKRKTWVTGR